MKQTQQQSHPETTNNITNFPKKNQVTSDLFIAHSTIGLILHLPQTPEMRRSYATERRNFFKKKKTNYQKR